MNNGNEKNHLLQGDGRVLGYVRKGVKISRPGEGKTDYRFFMDPLSPIPPEFQKARERGYGFTRFMNELGYPINAFPNEEAAEIAVQTVKDYKAETGSRIEVIFNVFKELDEQIYRNLLR